MKWHGITQKESHCLDTTGPPFVRYVVRLETSTRTGWKGRQEVGGEKEVGRGAGGGAREDRGAEGGRDRELVS